LAIKSAFSEIDAARLERFSKAMGVLGPMPKEWQEIMKGQSAAAEKFASVAPSMERWRQFHAGLSVFPWGAR
jgi:hypothetical protein